VAKGNAEVQIAEVHYFSLRQCKLYQVQRVFLSSVGFTPPGTPLKFEPKL